MRATLRTLLASIVPVAPAAGQTPPSADPALRSPGVDQVLLEQQRRQRRDEGYSPSSGGAPPTPAPGIIDGTPFTGLTGRLGLSEDGTLVLEPDDPSAAPAGRLAILPGAARARLQRLLASAGQARVRVTGQFYGYRQETLVLVSTFTRAEGASEPAPVAPTTPADPNPAARDLAASLEATRAGPRALDPRAEETPRAESRLREGEILAGRAARLITGPDGMPALAFDNDPDSPAWPPLSIVPCRMRERLEAVLAGRAEGPRVRASGRLLVEHDRAFVLPTFFQVLPDSDLASRQ